jgi:predicted ATP-dependent endonuclease of OLD family
MSITLQRYKRFEQKTEIDVAGDVVALVGPNEAGKSSILDAMLSLNETGQFSRSDLTRDTEGWVSVTAGYVLDDADRAALAPVPGGSEIRWWTYRKWAEEGKHNRVFGLHPRPVRDLTSRHATAAELAAFAEQENIHPRFGSAGGVTVQTAYDNALATLSSSNDSLTRDEINSIRRFAQIMFQFGDICADTWSNAQQQTITHTFCEFLRYLSDYDEEQSPTDRAGQILMQRRPQFLMFTPADFDLRTTYELQEAVKSVPPALANVARLADLDLRGLLTSILEDNPGRRETLLDAANDRLKGIFGEAWGQSQITVRLALNATTLQILVSIPGGGYSRFEERSAGLRSFVALRAFLAQHPTDVRPILLVDEAETHLHYDAQADLIDLFSSQQLAAKVIYTTHSAGCLPRDLGNGIRVVAPIHGTERSTVKKSVWEGKEAGFTPIIFGMGATTFAFLPARNVLLTEGITDAMLYPTIFREASGLDVLPFQVAPGLSSVRPARMLDLTAEGGSVLFLTDGDDAGRELRKELTDAGIHSSRVMGLDAVICDGLLLEDLIDSERYVEAINSVLKTFQPVTNDYLISDLPVIGRVHAISSWCMTQGLTAPTKVDVAQHLLDQKSQAAREGRTIELIDRSRRSDVAVLCNQLIGLLPPLSRFGGTS